MMNRKPCRGNGASVLRIIPYAALHFSAYESYREVLVNAAAAAAHKPLSQFVVPPYLDLIAGSAAGATAVLVRMSPPALLHAPVSFRRLSEGFCLGQHCISLRHLNRIRYVNFP